MNAAHAESMLTLPTLLRACDTELGHYKIHLATGGAGEGPLTAYFEGRFEHWQAYQTRRNFQCEKIVALIQLQADQWLCAGTWRVLGDPRHEVIEGRDWYVYATEQCADHGGLVGRVVVRFPRDFRAAYLRGDRYGEQLEVARLLPERFSFQEFPGYSGVRISMPELRHIVHHQLPDWRAALQSVAGIYVITNLEDGKQYVGKADGSGGIWGRWSVYASTSHGYNKELVELAETAGLAAFEHFQFSILEVCDLKESDARVVDRESHWKLVLRTREHGLNAN